MTAPPVDRLGKTYSTDQVAGGLPSHLLRGIALPEDIILNAFSPFVLPTAAYGLDHIVRLPLDLLDRWWGLVTTLDVSRCGLD